MADPKKPSNWTRDHKLATASLTVAVIAIFCGIVQADIRNAIHGKSPSVVQQPTHQPDPVPPHAPQPSPAAPATSQPSPMTSPTPPQTKINPVDGLEMVYIPPGEFLYGENKEKHTLPGYYIAKNLVTVAQYEKFCTATGRAMPAAPPWKWDEIDYPIVNVTWDDASSYCAWAGLSLPTEWEWEKAARGTDGREYPWGNDWDPAKCRCSRKEFGDAGSPSPVGSYPEGTSPYGVLDMEGNVREWCSNLYGNTDVRVVRGGGWYYNLGDFFRCAYQNWLEPEDWHYGVGFRCVSRPGR